ncbi:MAG: hypothetical protein AAFV54_05310 [Pseudomonadota bacterium]
MREDNRQNKMKDYLFDNWSIYEVSAHEESDGYADQNDRDNIDQCISAGA